MLNDKQISRYHARIEIRDNIITLIDDKSINGTYVNGEKIISEIVLNKKSDARFIPELDHLLSWKLTSIKGSLKFVLFLLNHLLLHIDQGQSLLISGNH